ncbi:MAG: hypothetical protein Q8P97_01165 [bacterium]|nr:hypothetical protein [bacterium]
MLQAALRTMADNGFTSTALVILHDSQGRGFSFVVEDGIQVKKPLPMRKAAEKASAKIVTYANNLGRGTAISRSS